MSEKLSSSSAVIPWGQRTRSSPRLSEKQLVFQVLDNPSLREEILKHVIIRGDKKVDHRTACTFRQVEKSWNESVLRILWKAHEPLYKVVPATGSLAAFTKTFSKSSEVISGPPPPLTLAGFSRLSQQTDLEIFSSFMTSCGPAILQLGLVNYAFGVPLPISLPPWTLSRLHKLDIIVALHPKELMAAVEHPEEEVAVRQEKIQECLITAIFTGATALAELDLSVYEWSIGGGGSVDVSMFQSITFPPTLVKIKLEIEVKKSKDFVNALLKSALPKVTSFSFTIWKDVFAEGLLFNIMDKWKTGLKHLVICGTSFDGCPRAASTIRFPVMEQLEELSLSSESAELESGLSCVEKWFPKLMTLRLRRQSLGMLRKWTESSRFSGVTCLELVLGFDQGDDFKVRVGLGVMLLVNSAFPNLRKLGLEISKSDPSGLWYVFQEMRELVELKLLVYGYLSLEGTTDQWDSILTGVSPEMIASIRGRGTGSQENRDTLVPITNLQELESLSVEHDFSSNNRENDLDPKSLISDFIFDHAFLKMPQLKHLHFEGSFKVSEEMTDKWINSEEGRSLDYQRFSESEFE